MVLCLNLWHSLSTLAQSWSLSKQNITIDWRLFDSMSIGTLLICYVPWHSTVGTGMWNNIARPAGHSHRVTSAYALPLQLVSGYPESFVTFLIQFHFNWNIWTLSRSLEFLGWSSYQPLWYRVSAQSNIWTWILLSFVFGSSAFDGGYRPQVVGSSSSNSSLLSCWIEQRGCLTRFCAAKGFTALKSYPTHLL